MKRLITLVALPLAAVALALLTPSAAHAIPAGGASADTPGTSAAVSTRSVPVGGTIRFTVTGFPAGEVVYVKIDDGQTCSSSSVHGACVVHQQRLDARGSASGSFVLPSDISTGKHWLRFLASQEVAGGGGGVKGYTARGDTDFTVTAAASTAPSTAAAATPAATATSAAAAAGVTTSAPDAGAGVPTAGATLHIGPPQPAVTVTVTAQPVTAQPVTAQPVAAQPVTDASVTATPVAAVDEGARPPYVGIAGLLLLLACAAGLVLRRRRLGRA